MYSEYNRPVEFFNLIDNKLGFLKKPDDKFISYIRDYFKTPEQSYKWFMSFKDYVFKNYGGFIVSQGIGLEKTFNIEETLKKDYKDVLMKVNSRDYLVKIYMYDTRFKDRSLMVAEQIISVSFSNTSMNVTVNTTFIDHDVLHSSEEELEQRSLDFIKADLDGDFLYFDSEDDI